MDPATPEKLATAPVNSPSSGAYGEQADLQRLRQQLPSSGAGPAGPGAAPQPPPISTSPVQPSSPLRSPSPAAAAPPGIPSVLASPTDRPYEPVDTLPQAPPQGAVVSDAQSRIRLLDLLAHSPNVSTETREWAARVLHALVS